MLRDVRLSGFFLVGLLTTTPLFAPPGDDQGKSHVPTRFRAAPPAPDNDLPSGVHEMGTDFQNWDYEDALPSGVKATETDVHTWRHEDAFPSGVRVRKADFRNLLLKLARQERARQKVIAPGARQPVIAPEAKPEVIASSHNSPQGEKRDKTEAEVATLITSPAPLSWDEELDILFQRFGYQPDSGSGKTILVNLFVYGAVYGTVATRRMSGALTKWKEIPAHVYSLIVSSDKEQTASSPDNADDTISQDWILVNDRLEGVNNDL